ncbi:hypothetical protein NE645_17245, partial [Roseburia hominis]|nr:hypothetical protein [Roseburia hominis]
IDARLRDDVHLLGELLGNTIRDQYGEAFLAKIERIRQFALDLTDSGLTYEAGDALGVRPRNCPELVSELLDLTRLNASTCVNIDTFGDVP